MQLPKTGMGTFGSDKYPAGVVASAVESALEAGYRLFDCWSDMEKLKKRGLVREIALSNMTVAKLKAVCRAAWCSPWIRITMSKRRLFISDESERTHRKTHHSHLCRTRKISRAKNSAYYLVETTRLALQRLPIGHTLGAIACSVTQV